MTIELTFHQIDAFTDRPFGGNPAAVIPLDHWLDDATLQAIAAENNLSEIAFIVALDEAEADYELRWFTPAAEVALCGHATLASGHFVLSQDPARDKVRFKTRQSGLLTVTRDGPRLSLDLPAWMPEPSEDKAFEAGLGIACEAVLAHPRGYRIGVLRDSDAVRALKPDFKALAALGGILAIATAPGDGDHDVVSRVFAPAVGVDEDPVTGSAHALLVPYWAQRLGRQSFVAYQASARGGTLHCRLDGDRAIMASGCVAVIEGVFRF